MNCGLWRVKNKIESWIMKCDEQDWIKDDEERRIEFESISTEWQTSCKHTNMRMYKQDSNLGLHRMGNRDYESEKHDWNLETRKERGRRRMHECMTSERENQDWIWTHKKRESRETWFELGLQEDREKNIKKVESKARLCELKNKITI